MVGRLFPVTHSDIEKVTLKPQLQPVSKGENRLIGAKKIVPHSPSVEKPKWKGFKLINYEGGDEWKR